MLLNIFVAAYVCPFKTDFLLSLFQLKKEARFGLITAELKICIQVKNRIQKFSLEKRGPQRMKNAVFRGPNSNVIFRS